jgi:RNA polymerase sigma-70 factor (ECF subfamily)
LIQEVLRGDKASFDELMLRHGQIAFRTAYLVVGDTTEAEDVVQEAFVKVYLNLRKFDLARPFRPWLLRIVYNDARNVRRRLLRSKQRAQFEPRFKLDDVANSDIIDPVPRERARAVWEALNILRPSDKLIIVWRHFLGLGDREISVLLKCPEGTAKSRLHYALKRLKDVIEKRFPFLIE